MLLNRALSILGGPALRALLVASVALLFAFRRRWWSAAMLITATGGMGAINTGLKELIRRQRPKGLPGLKQAGGYSFPSGHSSGSFVFLGALGFLAWRATAHHVLTVSVCAVSSILAGMIGRSRVGLQAHHRSDVLGGFAIGAVWLGIVLRLFARRIAIESDRGPDEQL